MNDVQSQAHESAPTAAKRTVSSSSIESFADEIVLHAKDRSSSFGRGNTGKRLLERAVEEFGIEHVEFPPVLRAAAGTSGKADVVRFLTGRAKEFGTLLTS